MSGFYKWDSGMLLHGPNFVLNAQYELRAESHTEHEYPVDGWYWFDTYEQAREALVPREFYELIDREFNYKIES